jgi:hypothetical protein
MTNFIGRESKKKFVGFFVTLLCSFVFHGCGSVVKNPTRPKPTPAQSESFANLLSGMVAEVLELLNAAEASLKTSKPKVGFECSETTEGVKILFKGVSQYSESLGGIGGPRNITVEDSQEHTHNWAALSSEAVKPACAPDKGLEQTVLDLNGLKLSYDFKQTTNVTSDSATTQTSSSGQRSLGFADAVSTDESRKTYDVAIDSETSRSVADESYDLKISESTTTFTYLKDTGAWDRKDFAGVFESSFESKTQAVRFENAAFVKGEKATCFPNTGTLEGSMVTAGDQSFGFKVDFASDGIPVLQFDGVDEKTELKVLNCIN